MKQRRKWATACKAQNIGRDDHLQWAAVDITQALVWRNIDHRADFITTAGAHLRAHRKKHHDFQGTRKDDMVQPAGDGLLWYALEQIALAAKPGAFGVVHERAAEAALRTWWKAAMKEEEEK
jgi:hypothetical protein